MKNVLINYLGRKNSGPLFSFELSKGFVKNGCKVYALLSKQTRNKKDWDHEKSIEKIFINTYNNFIEFVFGTLRFGLKDIWKVRYKLQNVKFDYVITPFFHPWALSLNRVVKAEKKIAICHDPFPHYGDNRFIRFLYDTLMRHSDSVVVLSEKFIPVVHEKYGTPMDQICYMPHGNFSFYKGKDTQKEIEYSKNKTNFLFFGRIGKYKGINILTQAYEILKSKNVNVSLTIAGSGNLEEEKTDLQKLKDVKIFNRYIDDEEVGNFFDSDNLVLVLPYLSATQSGVIPIAMEYGIPIIASNIGGLSEQLDNGRIGFLVSPGNVEDLASKMLYASEHPEVFDAQRILMKEKLKSLDWDIIVHNLVESLDKMQCAI